MRRRLWIGRAVENGEGGGGRVRWRGRRLARGQAGHRGGSGRPLTLWCSEVAGGAPSELWADGGEGKLCRIQVRPNFVVPRLLPVMWASTW
jgi:hypothetical protein